MIILILYIFLLRIIINYSTVVKRTIISIIFASSPMSPYSQSATFPPTRCWGYHLGPRFRNDPYPLVN